MTPSHPPVGRVYQKLSQHISTYELNHTLHDKLSQLLSLLYVISAEGAEVFTLLPESMQSLYLLTCTELAQDCVDLNHALEREVFT